MPFRNRKAYAQDPSLKFIRRQVLKLLIFLFKAMQARPKMAFILMLLTLFFSGLLCFTLLRQKKNISTSFSFSVPDVGVRKVIDAYRATSFKSDSLERLIKAYKSKSHLDSLDSISFRKQLERLQPLPSSVH